MNSYALDGGVDNNGNFAGAMNQGGNGGSYYGGPHNNFLDPGYQAEDGNGYNTPRSGGYPYTYQGNHFRAAWHQAKLSTFKVLQPYRHHNFIVLTLALLLAIVLVVQTHDWFLTKARLFMSISHGNLPTIGFLGVIASFTMGYTYWSVKHFSVQCARRVQCVSITIVKDQSQASY